MDQVLQQINAARAQAGLPGYTITAGLTTSATRHNSVMADGCGLSQQCPGEPPLGNRETDAGVDWSIAGENVGEGRRVYDGHVEMGDHAGPRSHPFAGEGKETIGRDTLPLRVAGREMLTDVAFGKRTENGVDQRMQRHVGIGMPGHAARMRNAHAAEHDMIAVGESVHVKAVPGAYVR